MHVHTCISVRVHMHVYTYYYNSVLSVFAFAGGICLSEYLFLTCLHLINVLEIAIYNTEPPNTPKVIFKNTFFNNPYFSQFDIH